MNGKGIKYIDCSNCKNHIQYTIENIHRNTHDIIGDDAKSVVEREYEDYIECPECGEHIVIDTGFEEA